MRKTLAVLFFLTAIIVPAKAVVDPTLWVNNLDGVQPFSIGVLVASPDKEIPGISSGEVEHIVRLRLKASGLSVAHHSLSTLWISVGISTHMDMNGFTVCASFQEPCQPLLRDKTIPILLADTWRADGQFGLAGSNRIESAIKDDINSAIDDFITAYKKKYRPTTRADQMSEWELLALAKKYGIPVGPKKRYGQEKSLVTLPRGLSVK